MARFTRLRFLAHLLVTPALPLAASLALLGAVRPAAAQTDPPEPSWTLNPDTVAADQGFKLEALSYKYSCAHAYANQKVTVTGQRIDLAFTATANPAALCPAIYKPYGPTFEMPALATGKYSVFMNLLSPCHVASPGCASIPPIEAAGTLVAGKPTTIGYEINPATVRSGTDFTLRLLSPEFACNTEFLRLDSKVQDKRITLTYLDKENPALRCIQEGGPYGPAFKLAGLAAGSYEVWAERLPACAEQGCKMAAIPQLAGKLAVAEDAQDRKGWFLKQDEVTADTPFTLSVVNNAYGNCHTSFGHKSLQVAGKAITASFTIVTDSSHVCVMDLRPHGPDFRVDGLEPGRYPVSVQVMPACAYETPSCLPVILLPAAQVVDTLVVSRPQALGLGGAASAARGPQAFRQGEGLRLLLPEGASGIWRAEALDLSGRRLLDVRVDAGKGAALLPLASGDAGVVLVRLTGPERGRARLIRVPPAAAGTGRARPD